MSSSSSAARKRGRASAPAAEHKKRDTSAATDSEQVLVKCRELRDELRNKKLSASSETAEDATTIPKNIVEVAELSSHQVIQGIENVALEIAHQVLNKQGFSMDIPSRASSNQVYVKEWDRIVLGEKRSSRKFLNVKVHS
jgi:meiotic recombination protein SPO11